MRSPALLTVLLAALLAHSALAESGPMYAEEFRGRKGESFKKQRVYMYPDSRSTTITHPLILGGTIVGVDANIIEQKEFPDIKISPSIAISDDLETVVCERSAERKGIAVVDIIWWLDPHLPPHKLAGAAEGARAGAAGAEFAVQLPEAQ